MFSPAYLRHVGSTSLQYSIPFDVGNADNPKALKWLQAPPTPDHALLSCLKFYILGENTAEGSGVRTVGLWAGIYIHWGKVSY